MFVVFWMEGSDLDVTLLAPIALAATIAISAHGMVLYTRRRRALQRATALAADDARRYCAKWRDLCSQPAFASELATLSEAWEEAQASRASPSAYKLQLGCADIEELFHEADAVNPLLQAKAKAWAAAAGGVHHPAPIKGEERALQKVFRSYAEDWRRLCDLCRTSIVLDTPQALSECLRLIAADGDIELLRAHPDKCRLRADFDADTLSGGYRDVQLGARLCSADARERRVHGHVVEIQLHLKEVYELKSGGGHKAYVLARNLRGD